MDTACYVWIRLKWMNACRSQWPRGLRSGFAAAWLLGLRVQIPLGSWMSVCCECRVLSSRGLCDGLITRPEELYRMWCVVVCDLETSRMRRPWLALGRSAIKKLQCIVIATNTDKGPHINIQRMLNMRLENCLNIHRKTVKQTIFY
jgi:hypothetical protein